MEDLWYSLDSLWWTLNAEDLKANLEYFLDCDTWDSNFEDLLVNPVYFLEYDNLDVVREEENREYTWHLDRKITPKIQDSKEYLHF